MFGCFAVVGLWKSRLEKIVKNRKYFYGRDKLFCYLCVGTSFCPMAEDEKVTSGELVNSF